jgi:hypothetical protein
VGIRAGARGPTPSPRQQEDAARDRLELVPVLPDGWRMRDRSHRETDASGLLGFAQTAGTGVDVVWLIPVPSTEHLQSLDELIAAATARCATRPA